MRRVLLGIALVVLAVAGATACLPPGNPTGALDRVVPTGGGRLSVTGWVIDPDDYAPATVLVHVDGVLAARVAAGLPRPDVAATAPYREYGPNRGFEVTLSALAAGTHRVCAYGVNVGAGDTNTRLGCRTATVTGTGPVAVHKVANVGDSLAVGVDASLRTLLNRRWPGVAVTTTAQVGSKISFATTAARAAASAGTDVVVVSSGANSLFTTGIAAQVATTLDATMGVPCVVWPTISERIYATPSWIAAARQFNAVLRQQATNRPWVHIADWAPIVTATPGYTTSDGLHHTAAGNAAFATLLADTIRNTCPA